MVEVLVLYYKDLGLDPSMEAENVAKQPLERTPRESLCKSL